MLQKVSSRWNRRARFLSLGASLVFLLMPHLLPGAYAQSGLEKRGIITSIQSIQPIMDTSLTNILGWGPDPTSPIMPPEDTEHFFGKGYGDVRRYLHSRGLDIDMEYWPEFVANLAGGLRQKQDYAHQISFMANADLDKLIGWKNAHLIFSGAERAGRRLSTDALADPVYNAAQIYGGGGNVGFHVVYFYFQKTWIHERLRWIIGRYATGPDYNSSMLNCSFMALAVCMQPRITTLLEGYVSWPSTAWGTNFKVKPTEDTYIVPGIFVTNPRRGGTAGTNWDEASGVTLINEIGWEPEFGPKRLLGHYKTGYMWDSSRHAYNDASGQTGATRMRHGQSMYWVAFDQMLWRHKNYATGGLIVLAGYTHVTASISTVKDQWYAGFLDFGLIPARPFDGFGMVYTQFLYGDDVASQYQPAASPTSGFASPLGSGLSQALYRPLLAKSESVMEVMYRFRVSKGLYFAPEFQYVWRPGGSGKVKDAPILGFDLRIYF